MRTRSISLTTLLAAGGAAVAIVAAPMATAAPTGTTNAVAQSSSRRATLRSLPSQEGRRFRPVCCSTRSPGFTPLELHHQVEHHHH